MNCSSSGGFKLSALENYLSACSSISSFSHRNSPNPILSWVFLGNIPIPSWYILWVISSRIFCWMVNFFNFVFVISTIFFWIITDRLEAYLMGQSFLLHCLRCFSMYPLITVWASSDYPWMLYRLMRVRSWLAISSPDLALR